MSYKLLKREYAITSATLKLVLDSLEEHTSEVFDEGEYGESYSDDDVIEARNRLRAEIEIENET